MAEEDLLGCCRRGIILSILLYIILLSLQIHQISAQNLLNYNCTNTIGNYTQDSIFHSILDDIISDPSGFYNLTLGKGIDRVSAMAFCGGGYIYADDDAESCGRCIKGAANNNLTKVLCPVQKEAIVWYDDCMFRYSNNSIHGKMSLTPFYKKINSTVVAPPNNAYWFSQNLTSLAGRLLVEVEASNNYYKRAAYDIIDNPNGETIYGFMQCTPDISSIDCKSCLNHTKYELLSCCDNVVGARYHTPSCVFRFEIYPFSYQTIYVPGA